MTEEEEKQAKAVEFALSDGIPPALTKYSTEDLTESELGRLTFLLEFLGGKFADPLVILQRHSRHTRYAPLFSVVDEDGTLFPAPEDRKLQYAVVRWAIDVGNRKSAFLEAERKEVANKRRAEAERQARYLIFTRVKALPDSE